MAICALPNILCTIVQKLLNEVYHKKLSWTIWTCYALGYIAILLIILVCSPLIPILLSPLLCSSAGRQRFKSLYKSVAVLPFNLLRFYHLQCKRQAQEIAFEREKPRPLPPLRLRRRLSQAPYCAESQLRASFFTKLPFEIRLQIYKEVIIGNGDHVHIVVYSPFRHQDGYPSTYASPNAMRTGKIRGYRCDHIFDRPLHSIPDWPPSYGLVDDAADAEVVYAAFNDISPAHFSTNFPKGRGWGPVALVQCCKQMYLEAIDLLYSKCCSFI